MIVNERDLQGITDAKGRLSARNTMRFIALWLIHRARMVYRPRWYPYFGISHEVAAKIGNWPQ
jgi:hypothetical protein